MSGVYEPFWFDRLESDLKGEAPIKLKTHFQLAALAEPLSLRNPAISYPPGPRFKFYLAVRLDRPLHVCGIQHTDYKPKDADFNRNMSPDFIHGGKIDKGMTTIPAGSLLMVRYSKIFKHAVGAWYAYTPAQAKLQNFQRVHSDCDEDSFSASHEPSIQKRYLLETWPNDEIRAAHLEDVALMRKLGL